jgi:Helitron helicase-like domain at N-terminus
VTGSERHLNKKALDALAFVAEKGQPTEFLTLTCDTNWREIQEVLHEGQTAFDRPEATTRVFHEKLKILLHNLRHGVYHGHMLENNKFKFESGEDSNPTVYIMYVIEYQHRGLPKAHIVYRLANAPPNPTAEDSPSVVAAKDKEIARFIDGWEEILEDGTVREHLPTIRAYRPGKPVVDDRENADTDQEAQFIYDDLIGEKLFHKCSAGEGCCKKAPDSACKYGYGTFQVCDETSIDERGFPKFRRPTEADVNVVVKLPAVVQSLLKDGKVCHMYVYMDSKRFPALRDLTFQQLFEKYHYSYRKPAAVRQENIDYFVLTSPYSTKRLYLHKYIDPTHIVRIEMNYPSAGEIFYLRLIMRKRAVQSWEDAFSWPPIGELESRKCQTYQDACRAAGYLQDEIFNEAMACFTEACATQIERLLDCDLCLLHLLSMVRLFKIFTVRFTKRPIYDYYVDVLIPYCMYLCPSFHALCRFCYAKYSTG